MVYRAREGLGPQIDMRPDGSFALPPRRGLQRGLPWPVRIGIIAGLVALVGAGIAGAAIALWLVMMLIPVIVIAGIVAWGAFRIQLWRARRASVRGGRDLFRP
jgi:hypothetical protein